MAYLKTLCSSSFWALMGIAPSSHLCEAKHHCLVRNGAAVILSVCNKSTSIVRFSIVQDHMADGLLTGTWNRGGVFLLRKQIKIWWIHVISGSSWWDWKARWMQQVWENSIFCQPDIKAMNQLFLRLPFRCVSNALWYELVCTVVWTCPACYWNRFLL